MKQEFIPANPDYKTFVNHQFKNTPFLQSLGVQLGDFGPGWCETALVLRPDHFQQDGYAHAGVIATLADHTAGMSAGALSPPDKLVLTVEYKINLLRPGIGDELHCRSEIIKAGRFLVVAQSDITAIKGSERKLIATATVTLALVDTPL